MHKMNIITVIILIAIVIHMIAYAKFIIAMRRCAEHLYNTRRYKRGGLDDIGSSNKIQN